MAEVRIAQSTVLREQLERFVADQQAALAELLKQHEVEKARIQSQILRAQSVLDQWNPQVEGLIDTLASAGIPIKAG